MSTKITLNQLIEELSGEAVLSKTKSQEFFSFLIESILWWVSKIFKFILKVESLKNS